MVEITVLNNGPLRVKGDVTLKDANGESYDLKGRDAISLCRCGNSENKPFCDGSHSRQGIRARAEGLRAPRAQRLSWPRLGWR